MWKTWLGILRQLWITTPIVKSVFHREQIQAHEVLCPKSHSSVPGTLLSDQEDASSFSSCCFAASSYCKAQKMPIPLEVLIYHKGNRVSAAHHSKLINLKPVICFGYLSHLEILIDLHTWPLASAFWLSHVIQPGERFKVNITGVPGWLSRLPVRLWLRSWSRGLWIRAPCLALCWQLGAWSLLLILCLPLSLTLPPFMLCLSLSQK